MSVFSELFAYPHLVAGNATSIDDCENGSWAWLDRTQLDERLPRDTFVNDIELMADIMNEVSP